MRMTPKQAATIRYYDTNAEEYARRTNDVDISDHVHRFLRYIPEGGHILDAGCGAGRDAGNFLSRGYAVTCFDAAPAMARLTAQNTQLPVRCLRFERLDFPPTFDGIWASASLLHVGHRDLDGILGHLADALLPDGGLFMSFKYGIKERFDGKRFFADQVEASLAQHISIVGDLHIQEMWKSAGEVGVPGIKPWLNCIAQKKIR